MKKLNFFLLFAIWMGCSPGTQKDAGRAAENSNKGKTGSNTGSTLVINENCFVFLWPDSIEIAQLKAKYSEEAYNTIVDDITWYIAQAGMTCDTLKIKYYYCDKDFIIFKNSEGKQVRLKRRESEGDMVLINLKKEPRIEHSASFDKEAVLKYFDR